MEEQVMEILEKTGALLKGHFILSSGLHSEFYVQCAKIFEYPKYGEMIGRMISEKILQSGLRPDVVIGPALGGIIVAYEVGKYSGAKAMFTEREEGEMKLRRGFELDQSAKVIIVEDVVTTGKSTFEVEEVVKSFGAQVIGYASIINRSGKETPFEKPYSYLLKLDFPTYTSDNCPMCEARIPAIKPGSRKK
ncbi:MAG TPA: orotate phosphoribosyltransferase [Fervidobacterium sp.]|nr:orotate phosphoribosyltransferase [Thermotogaceae bacterium]HOA17486.1 orotate phosphoribosyltransferase [Fervidobacterium sp.]HOH53397.1 orotate phosphoribosyltransferase [Fervidobacterium sp.]HOS52325.1 orotate phosphoribosyltransferase [Fervidobacterium sp.]HQG01991.1 orotate phosphoribosyltransferase [Fervidobacterium sp.]